MCAQSHCIRVLVYFSISHTWSRETNDERHTFRLSCGNWRDPPTFTVSPKPDLLGVNVGAGFQQSDCSQRITSQVAEFNLTRAARVDPNISFVIDECRNTSTRKEVGVKAK